LGCGVVLCALLVRCAGLVFDGLLLLCARLGGRVDRGILGVGGVVVGDGLFGGGLFGGGFFDRGLFDRRFLGDWFFHRWFIRDGLFGDGRLWCRLLRHDARLTRRCRGDRTDGDTELSKRRRSREFCSQID